MNQFLIIYMFACGPEIDLSKGTDTAEIGPTK